MGRVFCILSMTEHLQAEPKNEIFMASDQTSHRLMVDYDLTGRMVCIVHVIAGFLEPETNPELLSTKETFEGVVSGILGIIRQCFFESFWHLFRTFLFLLLEPFMNTLVI